MLEIYILVRDRNRKIILLQNSFSPYKGSYDCLETCAGHDRL